jgi:uncharacterized protein
MVNDQLGDEGLIVGDLVEVEVAYAKPEQQAIVKINVPQGTTIHQAIELSGFLVRFPEVKLAELKVGVFGAVSPLNQVVEQGDRVEIYRSLINDPKEARRQRAIKNNSA